MQTVGKSYMQHLILNSLYNKLMNRSHESIFIIFVSSFDLIDGAVLSAPSAM